MKDYSDHMGSELPIPKIFWLKKTWIAIIFIFVVLFVLAVIISVILLIILPFLPIK